MAASHFSISAISISGNSATAGSPTCRIPRRDMSSRYSIAAAPLIWLRASGLLTHVFTLATHAACCSSGIEGEAHSTALRTTSTG